MSIDHDSLQALAAAYTQGMTPIRGRRVVRLLCREFAGAAQLACWPLAAGGNAVLGVSAGGAALCSTTGRGQEAAVIRWRHGAAQGIQTLYSLLKDSLPATAEQAVDLASLPPPESCRLPSRIRCGAQDLPPWVQVAAHEASQLPAGGPMPSRRGPLPG